MPETLPIALPSTSDGLAKFERNLKFGGLFVPAHELPSGGTLPLRARVLVALQGQGGEVLLEADVVQSAGGYVGLQLVNYGAVSRAEVKALVAAQSVSEVAEEDDDLVEEIEEDEALVDEDDDLIDEDDDLIDEDIIDDEDDIIDDEDDIIDDEDEDIIDDGDPFEALLSVSAEEQPPPPVSAPAPAEDDPFEALLKTSSDEQAEPEAASEDLFGDLFSDQEPVESTGDDDLFGDMFGSAASEPGPAAPEGSSGPAPLADQDPFAELFQVAEQAEVQAPVAPVVPSQAAASPGGAPSSYLSFYEKLLTQQPIQLNVPTGKQGFSPPVGGVQGLPAADAQAEARAQAQADAMERAQAAPVTRQSGTLDFHLPSLMVQLAEAAEKSNVLRDERVANTPAGVLLGLNHVRSPGRLTLTEPNGDTTVIAYKRSKIVNITRTQAARLDSVADIMRKSGTLGLQDYRQYSEMAEAQQVPVEKVLWKEVEDKRPLVAALNKAMLRDIGLAFRAPKVDYVIQTDPAYVKGVLAFPVSPNLLAYRGVVDACASYQINDLSNGLSPFWSHHVAKPEPAPFRFSELSPSHGEGRLWATTMRKPSQLARFFTISAMGRAPTVRAVYALHLVGMMDFLEGYVPEAAEVLGSWREEVSKMRYQNHYDVLKIHWTAMSVELGKGHRRSVKKWEDAEVPKTMQAEFDKLKKEALERINKSFEFLSVDRRRKDYRDEVIELTQRIVCADLSLSQGKMAVRKMDLQGARYYAEIAYDLNPTSTETQQLLARVRIG